MEQRYKRQAKANPPAFLHQYSFIKTHLNHETPEAETHFLPRLHALQLTVSPYVKRERSSVLTSLTPHIEQLHTSCRAQKVTAQGCLPLERGSASIKRRRSNQSGHLKWLAGGIWSNVCTSPFPLTRKPADISWMMDWLKHRETKGQNRCYKDGGHGEKTIWIYTHWCAQLSQCLKLHCSGLWCTGSFSHPAYSYVIESTTRGWREGRQNRGEVRRKKDGSNETGLSWSRHY